MNTNDIGKIVHESRKKVLKPFVKGFREMLLNICMPKKSAKHNLSFRWFILVNDNKQLKRPKIHNICVNALMKYYICFKNIVSGMAKKVHGE